MQKAGIFLCDQSINKKMENDDIKNNRQNVNDEFIHRHHRHNRIWSGLILIGIGGVLIAQKLGAYIPDWILSWHMLLIVIGLFILVRSNFKNAGGFIMMLVGAAFLLTDVIPSVNVHDFIWPGVLIIIGLGFILRPRVPVSRKKWEKWKDYKWEHYTQPEYVQPEPVPADVRDSSEFVEINAVFGGVKKIVLSKNFRGGEINTFMGGAEINLQQADVKQPVTLEVNNVFGGTKIIIPSNWDIKNEVTAVFGGVEDKRNINLPTPDVSKSLILRGTCVFGGIEIKNF